ncbi:MAG: hypothetical protein QOC82_872 [Frankiaceae bacterium]|jgi:hypothetical protein|nr:hypothetical protein [Frankiaceae bacterium]
MRSSGPGRALSTALLLFAILDSTPTALAHNGVGAAFKGRAGPYTVYAYDGYTLPNDKLQYRLVLLDAQTNEPADDAHVAITASKPGAPNVTTTADVYANVVFYTLANPYPADWRVRVRLEGRLGHGEVSFNMHGYPGHSSTAATASTPASPATHGSGGAPVTTITAASVAGVVVVGTAAVTWRRRRTRSLPPWP